MTNTWTPHKGLPRHAVTGLLLAYLVVVVAPRVWAQKDQSTAKDKRSTRQLVGDDVSAIESLALQVEVAEFSEDWREALRLHREMHALRLRVQGADHWETISQLWAVKNAETKTSMQSSDALLYHAIATPPELGEWIDPIGSSLLRTEAIAHFENLSSVRDPTLGVARLELAQLLVLCGDQNGAEAIANEAVSTLLLTLGPDHPWTANGLVSLGYIQLNLGKPALAVQQMATATRIRENALGPNHILTAEAHLGWGTAQASLHRHVEAQAHFATALPIVARTHGRFSVQMGVIYSDIGDLLDARGEFRDASQFHRVASEILFLNEIDRHVGELVDAVFPRLVSNGERQAACDAINVVLDSKLTPMLTVDNVKNLGDVRRSLSTAVSRFSAHPLERFNTFLVAVQGPDAKLPIDHPLKTYTPPATSPDPKLTRAALRWAMNLSVQGRHREAELPCTYLVNQYGDKLRGDDYRAARVFQILAEILLNQGRYFDAYPHLKEWRTQAEKTGLVPLEVLRARSAFAVGRATIRQFGATRDELSVLEEMEQIVSQTARTGLAGSTELVRRHMDRAAVLGLIGRDAESESQAASAFADAIRVIGVESREAADSCLLLAQQQLKQGKAVEAERSFRLAYEMHHDRLPPRQDGAARAVTGRAEAFYALGQWDDALSLICEHETEYRVSRSNTSNHNLSRAFYTASTEPLIVKSLALVHLNRFREAFEALEQTRSRSFYDAAARGAVEIAARSKLSARAALEGKIFALLVRPVLSDEDAKSLITLREERNSLDWEISQIFARETPPSASIEQIQKSLPFDAAIITWVDFLGRFGKRDERWACILRAQGDPIWTKLNGSGSNGEWTSDDKAAELDLCDAIAGKGTTEECGEFAEAVSKRRFEPLQPHLCGVRKLLVTADWLAKKIPVEVIAEGFEVSYVPSGTYFERSTKLSPPKTNGLLVFGDPDFPNEPTGNQPTRGLFVSHVQANGIADAAQFRPGDVLLAYADEPVDSLEKLDRLISANADRRHVTICCWRPQLPAPVELELRVNSGSLGATFSVIKPTDVKRPALPGFERLMRAIGETAGKRQTTIHQKKEASEQTLEQLRARGDLRRFSHLFFGTHGAQHQFAMQTGLQFPVADGATEKPNSVGNIIDGELTATEVLNSWELDADLATLAACGSGLGQSVTDEGLLGFSQAFLLSGSRSVCVTLWNVREFATTLLMDRFYRNLLDPPGGVSMSKSAALAEAKGWLRSLTRKEAITILAKLLGQVDLEDLKAKIPDRDRPYDNPFFWAAFVLVGQR